jgi:hypothetical protein
MRQVAIAGWILLMALCAVGSGFAAWTTLQTVSIEVPPIPTIVIPRPGEPTPRPAATTIALAAPFGAPELWVYNDAGMARDVPDMPAPDRELILRTARLAGAACSIPSGQVAHARVLKYQDDLINVMVQDGACARFTGWVAWP